MSKTDGGADFFDQINEAEVSHFQEAQILVREKWSFSKLFLRLNQQGVKHPGISTWREAFMVRNVANLSPPHLGS
ncbi:hypothetical protein POTOM_007944 [Populus tomentosa]|uniref:Uncharacterized protein n=1 Tax=Populus tomentosa TaxID=118781 RepID=A0A8X8ADL4_POPTO|nr:hypothetical protein POTOM_007944 [Populus tomentosa]